MVQLPQEDIVQLLQNCDDKYHALVKWITDCLRLVHSDTVRAEFICKQIQEFVRLVNAKGDEWSELSLVVCQQLSCLYMVNIKLLKGIAGNTVYDSVVELSKVISEERPGSQPFKKSKKKAYIYSPAKLVSTVILRQCVICQVTELKPFFPCLLTETLKSIKKMVEKPKYMHGGYLGQLMLLVAGIYERDPNVDSAITSKYIKTFKLILESARTDEDAYPALPLCAIIRVYGYLYKSDRFLEGQVSSNHLEYLRTKFLIDGYGLYGFFRDNLRQETSTCLAEILHDWYFEKKLVLLEDIITFLSDLFITYDNRCTEVGMHETLIHFFNLSLSHNEDCLTSEKYLTVITTLTFSIFENPKVRDRKLDYISRCMKYFEILHGLILCHMSESSQLLMLFSLFDCEKENTAHLTLDKEGAIAVFPAIVFLQFGRTLMNMLSATFSSNLRKVLWIRSKLLDLSINDNFQVRIHAAKTLKTFLTHVPSFLPDILNSTLDTLSKNLFASKSFSFSKCHGLAFILASLADISEPENVPSELIMRINIFATTILKDHPPSSALGNYYKQLIAWILLCGLINYKNDDFLRIQSSQLFLFWKSILTHNFSYRDEDELYKNVELRNHALACLLSYLNKINLDAALAKQVSFLLTKCSTFNNSVQIKTKTIDNILLQNESRLLQVYLKIHDFVKHDFNSAILILIVKNFADPNLYTEPSHSFLDGITAAQDKSSKGSSLLTESQSIRKLFCDNSGFAYGLSSKIEKFSIDELKVKNSGSVKAKSLEPWDGYRAFIFSDLEAEIYRPISSVFSYDCLITLYGINGYSEREEYSPRVTTSIINSSMEVFSLIFPYLNDKIQCSVLESMNSCIFSKKTVTSRSMAISFNSCVAIYSALVVINNDSLSLRESVASLILKIVKGIPSYGDEFLVRIKAECVGLTLSAVSKMNCAEDTDDLEFAHGITEVLVKDILDCNEPFSRVFNVLSLSSIFRYKRSNVSFLRTLGILEDLIKDPHPIVHAWSLEALSILIEGAGTIDNRTASKILILLQDVFIGSSYGKNASPSWSLNYYSLWDTHRIITKIFQNLTQLMGPEIKTLSEHALTIFNNILFLSVGIPDIISNAYGVGTITNLAAFKLYEEFGVKAIISAATFLIRQELCLNLSDLKYGSLLAPCGVVSSGPYNHFATSTGFAAINQLVRLDLLNDSYEDFELLAWSYFNLTPTSEQARAFIKDWFDHTSLNDSSWADRLYHLYFLSTQKLWKLEIENKRRLDNSSDLGSKDRTTSQDAEAVNAEERGFTDESHAATKVDRLAWPTRLFILDLLRELFLMCSEKATLRHDLQYNVSKMIKICFSACTMKLAVIKKAGIELLGLIIGLFSPDDELAAKKLKEEEAPIVGALMPAFEEGGNIANVASALSVCACYLSTTRHTSELNARLTELLVSSLAAVIEKPEVLVIGQVRISSVKCKNDIEMVVLKAWADLTIRAVENDSEALLDFVKPFWDTLVPSWILILREQAGLASLNSNTGKGTTYGEESGSVNDFAKLREYWMTYAEAISCVSLNDPSSLHSLLKQADLESFVFVVYAQCLQHLTLNFENRALKLKMLDIAHKFLKIDVSSELFFMDDILEESVEIFERIVFVDGGKEQSSLVLVIEGLILKYLDHFGSDNRFILEADKVYLLIRVLMMIISSKIPFLKNESLDLSPNTNHGDLNLLKVCFSSVARLICQFPTEFRVDLNACMLYISGRIIESSHRDALVPTVLPLLKEILSMEGTSEEEARLILVFFEAGKQQVLNSLPKDLAIATFMILSTYGDNCFSDQDIALFVELLYESFSDDDARDIAFGAFKSSLRKASSSVTSKAIVRRLLSKLLAAANDCKLSEAGVLSLVEVLIVFSKEYIKNDPETSERTLTFSLSSLLMLYEQKAADSAMVFQSITSLFEMDLEQCKTILNDKFDSRRRLLFSELVTSCGKGDKVVSNMSSENNIELKTFI
ncbi:LADA_0H03268g1_1 [Lachancea dasiensis]|uniref:LADA_0H03268g1_1 n=1 Tax=Lachancea dasiensis TaxID=1072105 RepID=A0A1G4K057_9SACH|nr:LADA_0H03268g1_1 [Lachancea dasiensis]